MADQSISQLPVATTLTGDELAVVVQNGITKQTQVADIANAVAPGKFIDYLYFDTGSDLIVVYTDTTTQNLGPIPGYIAATINSVGHLILTNSTGGTTDAGSVFASLTQTFTTVNNETATLPNSQRLVAGSNISLTSGVNTLTISASGSAGSLNAAGTGIIVKDTSTTVVARTLTSTAGISITNPDGLAGNPVISPASKLADIQNLATTGILAVVGGTTVVDRNIIGTASQITVTGGDGSANPTISISPSPVLPGTGSVTIPTGTTAQRPGALAGQLRFNSTLNVFEGQNNSGVWQTLALGGGVTSVGSGTGLTGGPITSTGTISIANTTVTAGTYGSATQVPVFAVNAQGQLTSVTNTTITASGIGAITAVNGTANEITTSQVGTVVTVGIPDAPIFTGTVTTLDSGVSSATVFPKTIQAFEANSNDYRLVYARNDNNGSDASMDIVAYNDASDVDSYFIDMGISSSNYTNPTYTIFPANGAYLYTGGGTSGQASALLLGTSNAASDITLFTGGTLLANTRATVKGNTGNVLINTTTDTGYKLNVNGTTYFGGASTFGSTVLLNANPTLALQAATKQYVDAAVSTGFTVHAPAVYGTTGALPANTYNNGASGVGATLTATANGALSVDGSVVVAAQRILVRGEAAAANNGCYVVTQVGSAGTPYILTRATDFNTAAAGNIANNAYFFITSGATQAGDSYVLSQTAAITVGTTALPFTLFADQAVYSGGTNITVAGQIISVTGTIAATLGGTGTSTTTTGDLLYGTAGNTWSKLPLGVAYKSLMVNASGTQVEWNAVALNQTTAVSGQLNVSNGGTGASTLTGYVYGNGTSAMTASTTIPTSALSGLGTGVATALGVNVGSAGAFVVNGGALGTPSSGTVTNLTGTASININGTVGATTANTGAFTTLSASSTVSGTGFSNYLASPPAIGGTVAAAITGTTITATKYVGISGGTF